MQFKSPEKALSWAYETTNRPIVKISSVNEMRGSESISESSFTPFDLHAQAAFIISMCNRVLSPAQLAYVRVQYGRELDGFDLLVNQVAASWGTGVHNRRGIEKVIRIYCGEKGGLREIKRTMACGMLKAASLRNRGYDTLDALHAQAMSIIWENLQSRNEYLDIYSHISTIKDIPGTV